ncbi:MAG: methyltransferase domain-containing protein [Dinoroseobacter sp.]|nr:methyltransferase domain-containing protein [Dinoroseobacter sp.]
MSKCSEGLLADLAAVSKHSHYQALHPSLSERIELPRDYEPRKLLEAERDTFVVRFVDFTGASVADIGANTGYFTLAAVAHGATQVLAIEGNRRHASFLSKCVEHMELTDKINIENRYIDFVPYDMPPFDITICFNVLHHLGDDFRSDTKRKDAFQEMAYALYEIVKHSGTTIFQIGFNWKGDRYSPLTSSGTKREIVEFVEKSLRDLDVEISVGCFDPETKAYQLANEKNMARFDDLGEFANRPVFIIKRT